MTDIRLRPDFDQALRDELAATIERERTSRLLTGRGWPLVALAATVVVVLCAVVIGGAGSWFESDRSHVTDRQDEPTRSVTGILKEQPSPSPGGDKVEHLSDPVSGQATGTTTIDLGPVPTGATHLEYAVTCIDAGRMRLPNGGGLSCSIADVGRPVRDYVPLVSGSTTFEIRALDGMRWNYEALYSRRTTTPWAVNANGDTYGVGNLRGEPDLVAVVATNNREGYARKRDLDGFNPRNPEEAIEYQRTRAPERSIPVYKSDGETVIGHFVVDG